MITSSQNSKIKEVRSLLNQKGIRLQTGKLVLEGVRLVEEALQAGTAIDFILYSDTLSERGKKLLSVLQQQSIALEEAASSVMQSLSDTETSQGILAVVNFLYAPCPIHPDFLVLLDQIRDPGNMGTLLRTSVAAGAEAILITAGCVDVTNPKVVRSAMGAHFRIPIVQTGFHEINHLLHSRKDQPIHMWISDVNQGTPYWQADLREACLLAVGGEAEGVSPEIQSLPHQKIHIPMPGKTESLNAAVAAAILEFEVVRQRFGH